MSWLIPSAIAIAGAAALIAVALHFIARSRPLAESFPTARFVPDRPIHARTRALALSDLLLLLLRLAAIAAIGVAVAGPMLSHRGRVTRIVVVDRSRAVASVGEVRDSTRAVARADDIVIPFDSAAGRVLGVASVDSMSLISARGSLSAALAAAQRAAVTASSATDSLELVVVSPLSTEEVDEATLRLRGVWPGRVRVVPVRAAAFEQPVARVEVRGDVRDAVVAGLLLMNAAAPAGNVRVVRGPTTSADSAWARAGGHVLVHWPASDADANWAHRVSVDAIGGVTSATATLIARFPRSWTLDGRAVARWADGEPAAVEHAIGDGCIRDVAVLIDQAGDLTLRASFRRFAASLFAPCGGARATQPLDSAVRASFGGAGPLALAASFRDRSVESSRWTPWLLALGALLLTAELAMRRPSRGGGGA